MGTAAEWGQGPLPRLSLAPVGGQAPRGLVGSVPPAGLLSQHELPTQAPACHHQRDRAGFSKRGLCTGLEKTRQGGRGKVGPLRARWLCAAGFSRRPASSAGPP